MDNTIWLGFSPDTSDDDARLTFGRRFGRAPAYLVRERNILLAGPIPAREDQPAEAPAAAPQDQPAEAPAADDDGPDEYEGVVNVDQAAWKYGFDFYGMGGGR